MTHPYHKHREVVASHRRVGQILKGYAAGGALSDKDFPGSLDDKTARNAYGERPMRGTQYERSGDVKSQHTSDPVGNDTAIDMARPGLDNDELKISRKRGGRAR